jgi:cell wall-associated NlpC family hydrolase
LIKPLAAGLLSLALAACATPSRQAPHILEEPSSIVAPTEPKPGSATPLMIESAASLVQSATSMIGQPYRYGGTAPGGFDCSGLVSYAAASAGIRVPRTAAEQVQAGQPVARRDLQAGDLIFMHFSGKELHVGIALDRDFFVHAPSSRGKVRIDSLLAPPYAGAFIGARRVVLLPAPTKDAL